MAEHDEPREGALLLDDDDDGLEPTTDAGPPPDDGKADEAANALDEVLDLIDLDVDIDIREDNSEQVVLDLVGPDAGRAIGKKGQTLDALQFIVNKIVNRPPKSRRHVVVDCGDYRERHDRGLVTMAKRQAKKAVEQGKVVTLEPMSARDRRVIHLSLAKFEGVSTSSHGHGTGRRIQIIPARSRSRR